MAQPPPVPPALPHSVPHFSAELSDALAELHVSEVAYDTDDAPMDALVRLRVLDFATNAVVALDVESSAPMSTVFASFCAASSAAPNLHFFYLLRDAPGSAPLDAGDTALSRGLSSNDAIVARLKLLILRLDWADGRQLLFKIKRTTLMGALFEAFYQKEGMLSGTFSFSLRSEPLHAEDTADSRCMSENDVIYGVLRTGADDDVPIFLEVPCVTVTIRCKAEPAIIFKVKRTTLMSKVFAAYYAKRSEQPGRYDFFLGGQLLSPDDTADSRGMADDSDVIDAVDRFA
jgi:hypothetical protein